MEYSTWATIICTLGLFMLLCLILACLIRSCCPFWISDKIGRFRERIYQTELPNFSKSPSLFSCNLNSRSRHTPHHHHHHHHSSSSSTNPHPTSSIPIVIVSDENGKRVMSGKDAACVYEKQDLEEIL